MESSLRQIKLLGEGAFGKCYLCENTTDGALFVVKQISIAAMSPEEKKEAYNEAKLMQVFDHPNITRCHDVYTTTKGKLHIVMEFADGGDLASKIQAQKPRLFPEKQILDWFVQICLALKHLHDRKVLHRDIKAQNIFLTSEGRVKLGDFGISKVLSSTMDKARTMVGTPYYLSPEIVENKPYNFKSDVWALGVLLYEMCTLKPPFDASSLPFLALKIVRGAFPPIPPHYTRELRTLVTQMLSTDSNKRPTVAQLLRATVIKSRIESLLSKTIRMKEFEHTVLHKQSLLAQPPPKNQLPKKPKKKPSKKPESSVQKVPEKAREEQSKQRDEQRGKMKADIQKKLKKNKGNKEVTVEWLGNDHERIIQELEDACQGAESAEELLPSRVFAWQISMDEDLIDRVDPLGLPEEAEEAEEAEETLIVLHTEDSTLSKIEAVRHYLEEKIGFEPLIAVQEILRQFLQSHSDDWNYESCAEQVTHILSSPEEKKLLPLIHNLLFLEEHPELY